MARVHFEDRVDGDKPVILAVDNSGYGAIGDDKIEALTNLEELVALGPKEKGRGTPKKMSLGRIIHAKIAIREAAYAEADYEQASSEEWKLWRDVLQHIASGQCEDPQSFAREAVKTALWSFARSR